MTRMDNQQNSVTEGSFHKYSHPSKDSTPSIQYCDMYYCYNFNEQNARPLKVLS